MANPNKGEALVQIEAGEFTLAFTLGALGAIEGALGKPLQEVFKELGDKTKTPETSTLAIVIWAALKKHHKLSQEEVGELVSLHEIGIWSGGIARAFAMAMPEAKKNARPRAATAAK